MALTRVQSEQLLFTQAGTSAAERTLDSVLKERISVKDFGALGDGVTDDTSSIQAAIDAANAAGGGMVFFPEGTYMSGSITIKQNVTVEGVRATIKATSAINDLVTMASDTKLRNMKIDSNNLATRYAVVARDFDNVTIEGNEVINYDYGIVAENDSGNSSSNLTIRNNYLHTPGNAAVYPIWVNAKVTKTISRGTVSGNRIVSVAGAYSPTNSSTADQIELHGVDNFVVSHNHSENGGEIGIVLSRLSQNCVVSGNIVSGCDADGIQIGSGFAKIVVDSVTSWTAGDSIVGNTSGASGTIEAIDGTDVYVKSLVSGKFVVGETATANSVAHTISTVQLTRNITCYGNICFNNGIDVDSAGGTYAGIKTQQTDDCSFIGNKCFDLNPVKLQQYGFYITQSDNISDSGNDFNNNLTGTYSKNGVFSFANTNISGLLATPVGSVVTISTGAITVTDSYTKVDTEGAASTDDLTTINGGQDGMRVVLSANNSTHTVVVKDGSNLSLNGDFSMDHSHDTIELIYNSTLSKWLELSRSDNA